MSVYFVSFHAAITSLYAQVIFFYVFKFCVGAVFCCGKGFFVTCVICMNFCRFARTVTLGEDV